MLDVVIISSAVFCDLIFTGLPGIPGLGQELYAEDFALCPGGMAANTGIALARLGMKVGLIATIGRYPLGDLLMSQLELEGLDLSHVDLREDEPTAVSVSMSVPEDRSFVTYPSPSHSCSYAWPAMDLDFISRARHVVISGPDVTPSQLAQIHRTGVTVTMDVGWESTRRLDSVFELLPLVDLFVPNELEACLITGTTAPTDALLELSRYVPHPVIKLGSRGSMAAVDGKVLEVPSIDVEPIDTTGAGDVFAAGLIYGYLKGWSMENCLRLGNVCGALSVTGIGGGQSAPGWDQIREVAPDLVHSMNVLGDLQ